MTEVKCSKALKVSDAEERKTIVIGSNSRGQGRAALKPRKAFASFQISYSHIRSHAFTFDC